MLSRLAIDAEILWRRPRPTCDEPPCRQPTPFALPAGNRRYKRQSPVLNESRLPGWRMFVVVGRDVSVRDLFKLGQEYFNDAIPPRSRLLAYQTEDRHPHPGDLRRDVLRTPRTNFIFPSGRFSAVRLPRLQGSAQRCETGGTTARTRAPGRSRPAACEASRC